jgi:hypothetical protein
VQLAGFRIVAVASYPQLSGDEKNSEHRNQQIQAMNSNNAIVGRLAASNNNITTKCYLNEIKTLLFRVYNGQLTDGGELIKLYKSNIDGEVMPKTLPDVLRTFRPHQRQPN